MTNYHFSAPLPTHFAGVLQLASVVVIPSVILRISPTQLAYGGKLKRFFKYSIA